MTEQDQFDFAATFQRLRTLFKLRGDAAEIQEIARLYFTALKRFPLNLVEAGAGVCVTTCTSFPKVKQWIDAIPRRQTATLPSMSAEDAREHTRAVELFYEDTPCCCVECVSAGVETRPLRFVPDVDENDRDVRADLNGKSVVRGHWIHGGDLLLWYIARDAYLALKQDYAGRDLKPMSANPLDVAIARTEERTGETREYLDADPPVVPIVEAVLDLEPDDEAPVIELESEWV